MAMSSSQSLSFSAPIKLTRFMAYIRCLILMSYALYSACEMFCAGSYPTLHRSRPLSTLNSEKTITASTRSYPMRSVKCEKRYTKKLVSLHVLHFPRSHGPYMVDADTCDQQEVACSFRSKPTAQLIKRLLATVSY